ncbi:Aspartyl aminopeptidase [Cyphellophora attinorum]|uniref:aspartyl aminopeptidase n=1 Tax=Cyphellophora attinorum TaxID=1664694 RepID=A0A0N0NPJ3_9EURO|nr:Aspartyl aminopeptidase [Phialophora attinorum]KPI42609.1 Aspartyl aminopeptidase [Phialophora attinorum]
MAPITTKMAANDFLDFVNASPTPYHAVRSVKAKLSKAGFTEIKIVGERVMGIDLPARRKVLPDEEWLYDRGFRYRKEMEAGQRHCMIGAHTDSPCLKIKPVSKKQGDGFIQVGVETYGGGLWHTWFDRDLGLAGRAMVRGKDGNVVQKLVHIHKPLLRIPTLAIHLDRQEKFEFNKETQLFPIAGLITAELKRVEKNKGNAVEEPEADDKPFSPLKTITTRHHSHIVELIAADAGVEAADVVDFEIVLYDTQKACLGGLTDEFIFSARLDNLNQTYCATEGLIQSIRAKNALDDESQGAFGMMLPGILRRISVLPSSSFADESSEKSYDKTTEPDLSTSFEQSMSSSFLLSADMAHSVNPNYGGKYESDHRPEINKGPVIKVNANARYATNSPGIVLLQEVARKAAKITDDDAEGVPLQLFVVRNDSSCGSTIGPMLSAHLGARTLDLGNPQLSMHSCRETGGADDVHHAVRLFSSFFQHYSALEKTILVD